MSHSLNIESALALDGRNFAMLTSTELELFELARAEGRKHGVIATIESEADPVELAQATSQTHQDEIMRRVNSTVSVVRSTTGFAAQLYAMFPPQFVTITQDKSQLERVYPKGSDQAAVESGYEERKDPTRSTLTRLCQKIRGNRVAFGVCGVAMLPFAAMATQIQRIATDDVVMTTIAEQAPTCVLVVAVVFCVLSVAGFLMPPATGSK